MKRIISLLCILIIVSFALPLSCFAESPVLAIDTSHKKQVYKNTFDSESALEDFKQFNGKWVVSDGRARLQSYTNSNMNTFVIYNGEESLKNLTDYVVEVDLYNVQTAAGLVARSDVSKANSLAHGYAGYNIYAEAQGTLAAIRSSTNGGLGAPYMQYSSWIFDPGDNIHIEAAFFGDIAQMLITDLDTGVVLWGWSGKNSDHASGSFGLMAYTKLVNGILDCRKSSFDNLTVSTLTYDTPAVKMTAVSGSFNSDASSRIDVTSANTLIKADSVSLSKGTVSTALYGPSANSAGIIFRYNPADESYYKLGLASSKTLNLYKIKGSQRTLLKSTSLSAMGFGQWGASQIKVVFDGNNIWGYLNDRCMIAVTDNSYLTGDGIGVYSESSGNTLLNFNYSNVSTPDKADILVWGHSHMQLWYKVEEELSAYGKVANLGVGGSNTPYWSKLTAEMESYDADTVIVMSGSNDLPSYPNDRTLQTLKSIFNSLKKANPDVQIILISEWYQPARINEYGAKVLDMNKIYSEYAEQNKDWITIVDGFSIALDSKGEFNQSIFTDIYHFGTQGYDELTKRTIAALENLKNGIHTGGDPSNIPLDTDNGQDTSSIESISSDLVSDTSQAQSTEKSTTGISGTTIIIIIVLAVIYAAAITVAIIIRKKRNASGK